jgi:hypothetical protein
LGRESVENREENAGGRDGSGKDRIEGGIPRAIGMRIWRAELIIFLRTGYLQVPRCVRLIAEKRNASEKHRNPEQIAELIPRRVW